MFYREEFYRKNLLFNKKKDDYIFLDHFSDCSLTYLVFKESGRESFISANFLDVLCHIYAVAYYLFPALYGSNGSEPITLNNGEKFRYSFFSMKNFANIEIDTKKVRLLNSDFISETYEKASKPAKNLPIDLWRDCFARHIGACSLLENLVKCFQTVLLSSFNLYLNLKIVPEEFVFTIFEPIYSFFLYRTHSEDSINFRYLNSYFDLIMKEIYSKNKQNDKTIVKQIINLIQNIDFFMNNLFDGECRDEYIQFYAKVVAYSKKVDKSVSTSFSYDDYFGIYKAPQYKLTK